MLLDFETQQYNNEVEKAIEKVQTNSQVMLCALLFWVSVLRQKKSKSLPFASC